MRVVQVPDDAEVYLVVRDTTTNNMVLVRAIIAELSTVGIPGERGLPGQQGERGLPGSSNLEILHGNGAPSDITPITPGEDGQLYVDDLTGNLYERIAGLWL